VGKLPKSKPPADIDVKATSRAKQEAEDARKARIAEKKEELRKAEKARLEVIQKSPRQRLRSQELW
jgi:cellobiose-specific phosphotransferase system component IIA